MIIDSIKHCILTQTLIKIKIYDWWIAVLNEIKIQYYYQPTNNKIDTKCAVIKINNWDEAKICVTKIQ